MILLTLIERALAALGLALLIAYIITEFFRADKVTPVQRECEHLMEKIGGCATTTELAHLADEVHDYLDSLKPTTPIKTIELLKTLLYTAMRDRGALLTKKEKV